MGGEVGAMGGEEGTRKWGDTDKKRARGEDAEGVQRGGESG
jgi:hypothetical protein